MGEREWLRDAVSEEDGDVLRVSRALVVGDPLLRLVPDATEREGPAESEAPLVAETCIDPVGVTETEDDDENEGELVVEMEGRVDLLSEEDVRADLDTELLSVAAADAEGEERGELVLVCDGDLLELRTADVDALGEVDALKLADTERDGESEAVVELDATFDAENVADDVSVTVSEG